MSLSSFQLALSRNRAYQWLSRLRLTMAIHRQHKPLLQAEFAEGDLYAQANCLFDAGYREPAIILGSTAVRRSLKRILAACPHTYYRYLPEKTSSRRQYATHELAYFFYNKGIIDLQLRRELSLFQKNTGRVAYGVKLSLGKGTKMMAAINAFRPQLDRAMGRAKLTLPALGRVNGSEPAEVVSAATVVNLTTKLATAIDGWHKRAFEKQDFPITDPVALLEELRNRALISRKQLKLGRNLFLSPQTLAAAQVKKLKSLLAIAQSQVNAKRRWLSDPEKNAIGTMVGKGHSMEEIYRQFGLTAEDIEQAETIKSTETIEPATPRDARQIGHRTIGSQMLGGVPCQS